MDSLYTDKRRKRVKLIFNPVSGSNRGSPVQLMDIIKELQAWKLVPEPYLTEPDTDYDNIVQDAIEQGFRMFVVCGGDGTVSSIARALAGTSATLGIIPTGTQNNVALSLGIPDDIPAAISLLRTGRRIKTDVGMVVCGDKSMPFLEVCSVGLFAALFESGDGIQHGDLSRIGDFLSTLTASVPSNIRLVLNQKQEIKDLGHVVMVSNMPYIGRHYLVGSKNAFADGLLDVLFCAEVPKRELVLGYMLKASENASEDPRIKHFRVRSLLIDTDPPMPVMADGLSLGEGPVQIEIRRRSLAVIVAPAAENKDDKAGDTYEK